MAANPTAMMLAWEETFKKFKASISEEDLKQIQQHTTPKYIISHLKKRMSSMGTTSGKLGGLLQDHTVRLQKFIDVMNQLAQEPAGLILGLIKFGFTVRSTYVNVGRGRVLTYVAVGSG